MVLTILLIMTENQKILNFKSFQDLFIEFNKLLISSQMLSNLEISLCLHMREIKSLEIKVTLLLTIIRFSGGKREQMDRLKLVLWLRTNKIKTVHKDLLFKKNKNSKLINKTDQTN